MSKNMSKHLDISDNGVATGDKLPLNLESCFRKLQTRSIPAEDDGTDEWSSGLEDGSRQAGSKGKHRCTSPEDVQEVVVEAASSVEEPLPSSLLPAFDGSRPVSADSPPRADRPAGFRAARPPNATKRSSGPPHLDKGSPSPGQSGSSAYMSFLRAERRLSSAIVHLNRMQKQQALHTAISSPVPMDHHQPGSRNSLVLQGIPHFPPASSPNPGVSESSHASRPDASPTQTPRRSRLARAFSSSPSSTASPGSPRILRSPQPGTPNTTSRRWSSAIQAILSPSPSLPRTFSPTLASNPPSPNANGEWQYWENMSSVDAVRKAQADLLSAVKKLAEEDCQIDIGPKGLKESVLLCAQAICCGLQLSASPSPESQTALNTLQNASRDLVHALTGLRTQHIHKDCPAPSLLANLTIASVFQETLGKTCCQPAADEDVFSSNESNSLDVGITVKRFLNAYRSFGEAMLDYDNQMRAERRKTRLERRLNRISKASALYHLEHLEDSEDMPLNIATLSSQELFEHSLHRAVREDLFSLDDIESFEPRLLLTLPRLALLYGVQESRFPIFDQDEGDRDLALQTPLEVFLPRLCRPLPHHTIQAIRRMSEPTAASLARRLCALEEEEAEVQEGTLPPIDDELDSVFRIVASEADEGGMTGKAGRHVKLMKRVLKLHLAENGHEVEAEDEVVVICKTMLVGAGLIR